jgi:3-deoxy-D-manno-octulosonic-acid transferase
LDSIGELAATYRFADVVFVGGSLVPRGGHNVVEAAAYAKPLIVGPHTENFRQAVADLRQGGGLIQLDYLNSDDANTIAERLSITLVDLLLNKEKAADMGRRAFSIIEASRGATECALSAVRSLLEAR